MAKVQNADRLRRKLTRLGSDVSASVRPAMEAGANEITALMKHLAPVLKKPHKGRRAGELRESIGWRFKETPGKDMEILISAGANNTSGPFYGRFVEFGVHEQKAGQIRVSIGKKGRVRRRKSRRTVGFVPAQPFFFPAFRAFKRSVGSKMTKAAKAALQKTAGTS